MKGIISIHHIIILMMIAIKAASQGVSISENNSPPDPRAILDIQSTSKGVLFPMLTTAQRDLITDPPHGLHIFNKDLGSLEYYDMDFSKWIVYCDECMVFRDTIDQNTAGYVLPPGALAARRIAIVVNSGVSVGSPCINLFCTDPAMDFTDALASASIIIYNYGTIVGKGGRGGNGGSVATSPCSITGNGSIGEDGGNAILSKAGTNLKIYNYGIIGGGGGGGGGGGAGNGYPNAGGGGGSGAGLFNTFIGYKGKHHYYNGFICVEDNVSCGEDGDAGTVTTGGAGGAGCASGGPFDPGFPGGNGGNLGQPGQNGLDSWYSSGGQGGQPGKAISGNPGNNTVVNMGACVIYGTVD